MREIKMSWAVQRTAILAAGIGILVAPLSASAAAKHWARDEGRHPAGIAVL